VPHYYFHLHNDVDARDPEGREFPDLKAARQHALDCARFTAAQTVKDLGHFVGSHRIDIENALGHVLDTVFFRDAVRIEV
jgi:hypothetical protein